MTRRKGLTIAKTRSALYGMARFLGDVQAAKTGRIGKRIVRRVGGRSTGRLLGKLFR